MLNRLLRPVEGSGSLGHAITLAVVLFGLWLLLSGHYTLQLLSLGVLSCLWVVRIATRMDVVDHEWHPIHLYFKRMFVYWVWLLKEIVKSNIDVTWRVLHPKLPISPTIVWVKASQQTQLGRVTYANSITLTPGTVSIDLTEQGIEVHSLTREAAEALQEGEMDRRIRVMEKA